MTKCCKLQSYLYMMCYDIHSRWNLVRRFFWHARSSIPVQTFFNTIVLQIREVDSDSSWSNIIEPPKNPTKKYTEKIRFSSVDSQNLVSNKTTFEKTTFQVPRVPPSFAVSLHTSAEPTRHRARRRAWWMWPMLNEYTLAKFPFLRSKWANIWNMINYIVVRFRNSCFATEFQFSEESLENPFCFHRSSWHLRSLCTTITKHHLSLWTAHGNHSLTRCPRLVRLTCFLGRTWPTKPWAWKKTNNQTTLTSYTPNNPQPSHRPRTPEMPWSKDYKWLKTAWSCHFHMIVWGFIDPKVGNPPPKKKKQTFQNPIGFFIVPKYWGKLPLKLKSCTPLHETYKMYMFKKKNTAKRISSGNYWAPSSGVRCSASSAWRIRASPATVLGMSEIPNKKCFTNRTQKYGDTFYLIYNISMDIPQSIRYKYVYINVYIYILLMLTLLATSADRDSAVFLLSTL